MHACLTKKVVTLSIDIAMDRQTVNQGCARPQADRIDQRPAQEKRTFANQRRTLGTCLTVAFQYQCRREVGRVVQVDQCRCPAIDGPHRMDALRRRAEGVHFQTLPSVLTPFVDAARNQGIEGLQRRQRRTHPKIRQSAGNRSVMGDPLQRRILFHPIIHQAFTVTDQRPPPGTFERTGGCRKYHVTGQIICLLLLACGQTPLNPRQGPEGGW